MSWIILACDLVVGVVAFAWGYQEGRRRAHGPRLELPRRRRPN